MPTLLDETVSTTTTDPAQRLRATMAAVRLAFTWFGVRKGASGSGSPKNGSTRELKA